MTIKAYIGEDGILKVQMPDALKNTKLEVLVVFQPTPEAKTPKHQG